MRTLPLDLADDLVDVAVQRGHRTEPLELLEDLGAIGGRPPPLRIDGEQWYMAEDHDWRVRGDRGEVLLDPVELVGSEHAEAVVGGGALGLRGLAMASARKWTPPASRL